MKKISLFLSIILLGSVLVACGGSTSGSNSSGSSALEVVGSTSVSPLMEVLGESYTNSGGATINIQV